MPTGRWCSAATVRSCARRTKWGAACASSSI
jgi:hypothetical protein